MEDSTDRVAGHEAEVAGGEDLYGAGGDVTGSEVTGGVDVAGEDGAPVNEDAGDANASPKGESDR